MKVDSEGNILWENNWGGSGGDFGYGVVEAEDNGFILAGSIFTGTIRSYWIRTDADGNTKGTWAWDSEHYHDCFSVDKTADGHYVLTGMGTGATSFDVMLLKLNDELGSVLVEMTPHHSNIQIPQSGGTIRYDIELRNDSQTYFQVNARIYVRQVGYEYPYPVITRDGINLVPGETITRDNLIQFIPGNQNLGEWCYVVFVYDAATGIQIAQDLIPFEIIPGTGDGLVADWQLFGWDYFGTSTSALPSESILNPPHPNPFNPRTTLSYELSTDSYVNLSVYDTSGRRIADLVSGWQNAGVHEIEFNASALASGIYFTRMTAGNGPTQMKKLILLK
jgi:hypothetical protein